MKQPKLLNGRELKTALKMLEGWKVNPKGTALLYVASFKNHIDALVFIARVTVNAQVANTHALISLWRRTVSISLK